MSLQLSLIIPAHNEGARLDDGFARLLPELEHLDLATTEVIVIDDGSSDDTSAHANRLTAALPHARVIKLERNAGKGAALKVGITVAEGARVVTMDADMAIHPRQVPLLLTALDHADLALGSRATSGAIRYSSPLRTVAGQGFNRLVRHWTGTDVRDTQCGFKGFQLGVARAFAIFGHVDGFAFDAEWLYLAHQLDLRVTSVPVAWDDVAGSSVSVGRDSLQMLRDIRDVPRSTYRTMCVRSNTGASLERLREACGLARVAGAVLARGNDHDVLVLPRDGAPGGLGIAKTCDGELGVVALTELRGRTFEAI